MQNQTPIPFLRAKIQEERWKNEHNSVYAYLPSHFCLNPRPISSRPRRVNCVEFSSIVSSTKQISRRRSRGTRWIVVEQMQTYFINVWVKCVWEHVGALKVAFSATKSSINQSIIIIGSLENVLISVSRVVWVVGRAFVQIFDLFSFAASWHFSLFVCLFCFFRSLSRVRERRKNKKYYWASMRDMLCAILNSQSLHLNTIYLCATHFTTEYSSKTRKHVCI